MQLSDIPAKFNIPFASSAIAPYIRTIPQSPSGTPGQAALTTGFPPENFNPVAAGGVPPFGADFNGIFNQTTSWSRWQATGRAFPPYDATFQTAIGGYPKGAIVESLVEDMLFYGCLVDNNVTNPDTGGAGWFIWSRKFTTNKDLYVNASGGSDSNNGLTPATAKATIQAAINTAWTFPPNFQFAITIHIASGTYAGFQTPLNSGPNIVVDGGAAASTIISAGSSAYACLVQGPNTLLLKNVTGQNTSPSGTYPLFAAGGSGAILTTDATISNACGGAIWQGLQGGVVNMGNHTVSGSCYAFFYASSSGVVVLIQGKNITISTPISVALATAFSTSSGSILVPSSSPPTFTNPGNVTGTRYSAILNGVIAISGNGINYFPGTVAGTTASGGQYA